MSDIRENIRTLLSSLYDQEQVNGLVVAVWHRVETFIRDHPDIVFINHTYEQWNEQDVILITYGDQFQDPQQPPLQTLARFLRTNLQDVVSGVHILPFYPYSSDDGFSVIDYRRVSSGLGTWQDISHLGETFLLMFDLVVNHVSSESSWFQSFLKGQEPYQDFFPVLDPGCDLSQVVRPRSTPLLTPFQTSEGIRHVWTTFSADQIDLDYSNPLVLLEMIDVLLYYLAKGARIIRLDAIAYLWKIPGTTCIHLPQTHAVIKLFRSILDAVSPSVLLITETNVPHQENISYFGDLVPGLERTDEAQMVYQFPLAPLILHTFLTGNSTRMTEWARGLSALLPGTTFFNFTASHDGIGVRPAEGLLTPEEIQELENQTLAHGGQVSYRSRPDGSRSTYELNITWYDALNDPFYPDPELDIPRFLASQAIMISLAGVPGIYTHSLFGSRNCAPCLDETGRARSINREKFLSLEELDQELSDPSSLKARVFSGYRHLLKIRRQQPAFHPEAEQRLLALGSELFAILRGARSGTRLLCLTNVTSDPVQREIKLSDFDLPTNTFWIDLLSGEEYSARQTLLVDLSPYQSRWLKGDS